MLDAVRSISIFQKQSQQAVFAAGDEIFQTGDRGQELYGILEGEVELSIDGKVVETLRAGDVFGEGALVHPDHLRGSTATAKTNCKLATMDEYHFLYAVQETPMFALHVMRSYSDRLRRLKRSL